MFVGHFAAGLAMRGRARQVPVAAYVGGAFVLDLLWVTFGVTGIDLAPWSDWSHSLLMAIIWSAASDVLFTSFGQSATIAIGLIVFSHYLLDLLTQGATLYPFAPADLLIPVLFTERAWLLQRGLTAAFLVMFLADEVGLVFRSISRTMIALPRCVRRSSNLVPTT